MMLVRRYTPYLVTLHLEKPPSVCPQPPAIEGFTPDRPLLLWENHYNWLRKILAQQLITRNKLTQVLLIRKQLGSILKEATIPYMVLHFPHPPCYLLTLLLVSMEIFH